MIGDSDTEQFEIITRLQGEEIGRQKIHDPFIHTTIRLRGLRHAWNALTRGLVVNVSVCGTPGMQRAIMTLDPAKLQKETDEILAERKRSRESFTGQASVTADRVQEEKK